MCCLRYEDSTYESLRKKLPHKQTNVRTEDGEGVVIDSQILTQLVLVKLDGLVEDRPAIPPWPLLLLSMLRPPRARQSLCLADLGGCHLLG